MRAVIRIGGKQFRVQETQELRVSKLNKKVGEAVELEVLMAGDDGETRVGTPLPESPKVKASIIGHGRSPKIIVFKKKRRKHYKRTRGHRQAFTTLKIESIE